MWRPPAALDVAFPGVLPPSSVANLLTQLASSIRPKTVASMTWSAWHTNDTGRPRTMVHGGYLPARPHATLRFVLAKKSEDFLRIMSAPIVCGLETHSVSPSQSGRLGIEPRANSELSVLPALTSLGLENPAELARLIGRCIAEPTGELRWQRMVQEVLSEPLPFTRIPFPVHQLCFSTAYSDRNPNLPPAPAWLRSSPHRCR